MEILSRSLAHLVKAAIEEDIKSAVVEERESLHSAH